MVLGRSGCREFEHEIMCSEIVDSQALIFEKSVACQLGNMAVSQVRY